MEQERRKGYIHCTEGTEGGRNKDGKSKCQMQEMHKESRDKARHGSWCLDKRTLPEAEDQSDTFELVNAPCWKMKPGL